MKSEETFILNRTNGYIMSKYPEILDFSSINSITVWIPIYRYSVKGLTLNPNWKDLTCKINYQVYICEINKNYFEEKKSGYYYIYHTNHLGEKSLSYEISPFKIIFSDKDDNNNSSFLNDSYRLIILLFFLILM